MVKQYSAIRKWMQENPGIHPKTREWAAAVDASVTWPDTTTTTTVTTTTTTT